jgi:predicted regulator of Ras-like GTPase activity (Roadblock/LC7/MglB family)
MNTQRIVQSISQTLSALRDIQGVHGSFFVSPAGRLVSKDLPSVFDEALFAEVAPRIVRLQETLTSTGDDLDMCLLRFAEHKLFFRPTVTGSLCVLMAASINLPALKMAVNLAARRINAELTGVGELPPSVPPSVSSPSSPPPVSTSQPPASSHPQIYRGHVIK